MDLAAARTGRIGPPDGVIGGGGLMQPGVTARYTGYNTHPLDAGAGVNFPMVTNAGAMILPPRGPFDYQNGGAEYGAKIAAANGLAGFARMGLAGLPGAHGWPLDMYGDARNWAGTAVSSSVSGRAT